MFTNIDEAEDLARIMYILLKLEIIDINQYYIFIDELTIRVLILRVWGVYAIRNYSGFFMY